jgi:hypothetical protein
MKHITNFESFVNESGFHAALAKAKDEGLEEFEFQGKTYPVKKGALKEGEDLNEAAADKYYTIAWNRDNEKYIFDYKTKILNLAESALKALPAIFDECCADKFDVDSLGFAFKGNAAFVFANLKDPKDRIGFNYDALENNKEFMNYFDLASTNLDSNSSRLYTSYFRLNDKKA